MFGLCLYVRVSVLNCFFFQYLDTYKDSMKNYGDTEV